MRLLLVEDEKDLSDAIVAILNHNNYSVDAVYDGQEALEYIQDTNYDAIILDVMLPKIDGIEVIKNIRKNNIDTPVIMLTAKSETDDKVLGLDSGANDYLTKPFATKELLARLRVLTRNNKSGEDSVLTFEDLKLNRATYELYSDKNIFRLANKEYQMIEMLMMNQNIPISTEKFMDKIWGYDSEAEINVVWTHISFLRRKLNQLGVNVQIKANRNTGYSLEKLK